ncbi:MAG TPA: universal stress protein [Desulfobacteraceae bacterium]|nr:universal stress protein [Desulfobacteraceae bacterium]
MNKRMDTILCAVDLSEYSVHVVSWGRALAKHFNASLVIFHAISPPRERMNRFRPPCMPERLSRAESEIKQLMQNAGCPWQLRVVPGDPVVEMAKVAGEKRVNLIIAASHGFSGFKRTFVGSVVERMVRISSLPFFVLRWRKKPKKDAGVAGLKKIIAACDRPPCFTAEYAVFFARRLGAKLDLVHCISSPAAAEPSKICHNYRTMETELETRTREQLLASLLSEDEEMQGNITGTILRGTPWEQVSNLALDRDCDLVVVGVKPRTLMGKLLTGSTTETMIRRTHCHVLVVPENKGCPFRSRGLSPQKPTGIVIDRRFCDHGTPRGHPESPERLQAIHQLVHALESELSLKIIPPTPASEAEILLVHSRRYLEQAAATRLRQESWLSSDTMASQKSYQTALLACGAVITGIDQLVSGKIENGFAFVRPPGHHAEQGRAMGFCIFNNVAVGAMYARKILGLSRVLIVDFDVHHGNGTYHIFERDASVLFFSTHQYPLFPGTGLFTETGTGGGEGFSINIPLSKGYGDGEFTSIFMEILTPIARGFKPDLILVSAGFDIHRSDPLGKMKVTSRGFAAITASIMAMARDNSAKLFFVLEGGYHLKTLKRSVEAVLKELSGETESNYPDVAAKAHGKKTRQVIRRCCHVHREFWGDIGKLC